jgi:hypothetical protein
MKSPENRESPNSSELKPKKEASNETKKALGKLAVEKSQKK